MSNPGQLDLYLKITKQVLPKNPEDLLQLAQDDKAFKWEESKDRYFLKARTMTGLPERRECSSASQILWPKYSK